MYKSQIKNVFPPTNPARRTEISSTKDEHHFNFSNFLITKKTYHKEEQKKILQGETRQIRKKKLCLWV